MERKSKNLNKLISFLLICSCLVMSIGYASINSITLDVSGEVIAVAQEGIFITSVEYIDSSTDIENNIDSYYQTMLETTIVLDNSETSSVTYQVTVYNSTDSSVYYLDTVYDDSFYSNSDITFVLGNIAVGDELVSKSSITFTITFYYDKYYEGIDNTLNSYVNFKFGTISLETNSSYNEIYNITDVTVPLEITNTSDYDATVDVLLNEIIYTDAIVSSGDKISIDNILDSINLSTLSLSSNTEYKLSLKVTYPYETTIDTDVIIIVEPTIVNYVNGFTDAGAESNPYLVYKIEDLVYLAQLVSSGTTFTGKYINMLSDLDFSTASNYYNSTDTSFGNLNGDSNDGNQILTEMTTGTGFIGIGVDETNSFQGVFDGGKYTISNLYINSTSAGLRVGLFSYIKNATIKNISVNGSLTTLGDGAALVAGMYGTVYVDNCHSSVTVYNSNSAYSMGGLVGTLMQGATGYITNCSNTGDVYGSGAAAGLVGFAWGTAIYVENCFNSGNIDGGSSGTYTAGLVVKDVSTGGYISISKSYNSGTITGKNYVGGLVAQDSGTVMIDSSYNVGDVSGTSYIGGILAYQYSGTATITNTYNAGSLSGSSYVGGIIGYSRAGTYTISTAYYLSTTASYAITNSSTVGNSYSASTMTSSSFVTTLGSNFTSDTNNINNGYPILTWQN